MTAPFAPLDFDAFPLDEAPRRLEEHASVVASADLQGLRPLAFRLPDGRAHTWSVAPSGDGVRVEGGDAGAHAVAELSEADWSDFVWELRSSFALLYAERVTFPRGHFGHLARWEPVLRAALDGQAVYDLESPAPVLSAGGGALDASRSFTLDDGDDVIADQLARAGFVHLRGVLDDDEVAGLRADVEASVAGARPDDRRSWWTTVDGREVCNRVNYLNEQSERIAALGGDPRFVRIGGLAGTELRECADRLDGHGVVIKVPGASSGLADLPWHRDCGMGGHPVKCPLLNVGIQLDPARAESGRLHFIAGSHRGTSGLPSAEQAARLPEVAVDTEPGDVTVHLGHVLHAAPPPTDRDAAGRRALYLTFVPPRTFDFVGAGEGYNDVLFTRDAGRVRHVDELR